MSVFFVVNPGLTVVRPLFPGLATYTCWPAYQRVFPKVFFILSSMKVFHTIRRQYPNGTKSTWVFGKLPDGRFAAKGLETGKKIIFKSLPQAQQRLRYMMWTLGYTKVVRQPVVKQLSLALA